MPFIPMPMPKPVCRTKLFNKIVNLEVCLTCSGRGMGMNITARNQQEATGGFLLRSGAEHVCTVVASIKSEMLLSHVRISSGELPAS